MNDILLLSEATVKSNSAVNNNVDSMYILPAIQWAQDEGLQPLIGSKLYRKLLNMVDDGSISIPEETPNPYKILLDEYITPYLINKVCADIQLPLAYKMRNQGVVQQTNENTYVPSIRDVQYIVQFYDNKANFYANRLSAYLQSNRGLYPEYCSVDSCADMRSNPGAYKTNVYLG